MNRFMNRFLTHNLNYKVVALFIAVILWVALLGRRDLVLHEYVDLQVLIPGEYTIKNRVAKRIRVKLTGPRAALKKFSQEKKLISIDMPNPKSGVHRIEVPTRNLDLPVGVKVVEMEPEYIRVVISKLDPPKK